MTDVHARNDERPDLHQLIEHTEGRTALRALGDSYTRRLHRRSDDFDATQGLRLVTAKLQRTPYAPPVVTKSS